MAGEPMNCALYSFDGEAHIWPLCDGASRQPIPVIKPENDYITRGSLLALAFFQTCVDLTQQNALLDVIFHRVAGDSLVKHMFQGFRFMPAPSLLAAVTAEVVMNDIRCYNLEKAEEGVLVVALKLSQGLVVVGAELEIGVLNEVVDEGWVHHPGPATDGFGDNACDQRLRTEDEFCPQRFPSDSETGQD